MELQNLSDFVPICGIYKITNTKNKKVYIGKSVNINVRWFTHVYDLEKGKHSNKNLLKDFQKMGIRVFTVEIIEECNEDMLSEREWFHMTEHFENGHELYNVNGWGNGSLFSPNSILIDSDFEYAGRPRRT